PICGWPSASSAAAIDSWWSSWARQTMRCPMRPQAPLMARWIFILRVYLNRPNNLLHVVAHLHGAVAERAAADVAVGENLVEGLGIGAVVGDCRGGILELMASEDTDDAVAWGDHAFAAKGAGAGHAGRRCRLAAEAARSDLRLGIQDVLIADLAD